MNLAPTPYAGLYGLQACKQGKVFGSVDQKGNTMWMDEIPVDGSNSEIQRVVEVFG